MMMNRMLSGLRALDLTDEKGFICGKILATLGVEVIKVERPGGDPSRKLPPTVFTKTGDEIGLSWLAYNTDKRSISLNLEDKRGRDLFIELVRRSHFILESFNPGYLEKLGLGYEVLEDTNPSIIVTSITTFGKTGPYSHYKGCELIASAMSGVMSTTGDPDRAPLREGPDSIYLHSGAAAALATLIAYWHCVSTGEGQQVDVSIQEVTASRTSSDLIAWEFDKRLIRRNGDVRIVGARATRWIWKCKDGYIFWPYMGGPVGAPANRAVAKWIDDMGLDSPFKHIQNWEEFDMAGINYDELEVQQTAIANLFARLTKEEIAREGLKRGIRACPVNNPAEVMQDIQLLERDYWVDIKDERFNQQLKYPKYFFKSSITENYSTSSAPDLGEANDYVYLEILGLSKAELLNLKKEGVI